MEEIFTSAAAQNQWEILINIALAAVLTGLVGYEREMAHKPAGFRTQMIIGASAALLMSLGMTTIDLYSESDASAILQTDPIRIFEAIVVGISFIGAGTIIKSRSEQHVQYLTTAATILMSTGIGIAVALQQYLLAVGVTVLILVINIIVRSVERKVTEK